MNDVQLADRVAAVRAFNRLYTGVIGVLDEGPADAEYSLPEARVLFELAHQDPLPVTDLRKRLDLDAGYASRLLARLESRGLIVRERSDEDARRQLVRPTAAGRDAFAVLNRRSTEQIERPVAPLCRRRPAALAGRDAHDRHLVGERRRDPVLVLRPPRPGDLGWVVERHGALYGREYGFDERFEGLVARDRRGLRRHPRRPRQAFWIAELDGERVGGIACTAGGTGHREAPAAAARAVGARPRRRQAAGHRVRRVRAGARLPGDGAVDGVRLTAARAIYRAAGFELVREEPDFDGLGARS